MNIRGPFYFITKKTGKAIWDYRMISDGDKVIVAVSGGKDSLCLLKIMQERLKFVPIDYELIACHVDMGFPWVNADMLADYFEKEGLSYIIARPPEDWTGDIENLDCFWCSWNRRKAVFDLAGDIGANKIAFAHHMDDIIETMLLNLFFQGEIGTMMPYQDMFDGELAIIRPLAYVEEKELTRLATILNLPVIASECPRGDVSKRNLVKGIVADLKKHNRNVKKNIFRSLAKIRQEYLPEKAPR
ncbi:MAG: tRNA 2-thiocytidine biosynthesis protein TtcA [Syntrophorhabdus sp. PtaB.Bin184]|jgi:tRNA 2-thiocytidine biosynthesis protein TtcA|nr:MAG: tRNA 2-thiocytidine biosynthesis protein TtcA [Syntrophorhabdus sp. PtaB.Bin184]